MSSYLGVPPQSGFITTAKQRVTSSTNNYVDLDHSISSLADVIVWVNFVKQSYTNLTLTTSSRITLGATLVASDIVEIAYLGKAVATQDVSDGSLGVAKLSATGTKSSSTFLAGDNSFKTVSGTTINTNADNRVITGSGTANTLNGEANLTFDGSVLDVNANIRLDYNSFLQADDNASGYVEMLKTDTSKNTVLANNKNQGITFNNPVASERMRIDHSGNVLVGTTTAFDMSDTNNGIQFVGGSDLVQLSRNNNATLALQRTGNDGRVAQFYRQTTEVGYVEVSASSTFYATSSDYRLKENEVAISDGITRLKQLKPYKFNFKADADKTVDGFFAHEVSPVVPEAISGTKDAMAVETKYTADDVETQGDNPSKKVGDAKTYSTTEIDAQGIDQSKLVPLLTSALQEAITKIETLEARVQTLENA